MTTLYQVIVRVLLYIKFIYPVLFNYHLKTPLQDTGKEESVFLSGVASVVFFSTVFALPFHYFLI